MTPDWLTSASKGAPMPSELPPEEQLAYQALAHLYARYRLRMVSKETAAKEKAQILSTMQKGAEARHLSDEQCAHWVRIWNTVNNGASEFRLAKTVAEQLMAAEKMLRAIEGRE